MSQGSFAGGGGNTAALGAAVERTTGTPDVPGDAQPAVPMSKTRTIIPIFTPEHSFAAMEGRSV